MWIRSRLSLLFLTLFLIYLALALIFIRIYQNYESSQTAVYFINMARYEVQHYLRDLQGGIKSVDVLLEHRNRMIFIANSSHGLTEETRIKLFSFGSRDLGPEDPDLVLDLQNFQNDLSSTLITMEHRLAASAMVWPTAMGVILILVVGGTLIAIYSINQSIHIPIVRLAQRAEAIGRGNLSEPVEVGREDEIGLMARAVEAMRLDLLRLISDLDEANRKMKDQEKMASLGEMSAAVAHSIRNPLAAIRSSAQLAARTERSEALDDIIREVDILSERLTILLHTVHPGSDVPESDLEQVVRAVLPSLDRLFSSMAILYQVDVQSGLKVEIPPSLLELSLMTLLENASEASSPGGVVRLAAGFQDGSVLIEVHDRGKGMDSEKLRQLFVPFTSRKPGGAGIGLSLTRKIIESYGGSIRVESEVSRGTCVWLTLPGKECHA